MSVNKSKNPVVATMSGAIAGGIEATSVWPMEFVKTNLQLGTMKAHYTGMVGGLRYHVQKDGFLSLYRGLAPVLMWSIPKAGIRFGVFDYIKGRLADENGKTSAGKNLLAGMTAGALEATLAVTPMETIKTKLINANSGMLVGMRNILAKEGIMGFYQGWAATVLKQASNQGLRFMWFTEYKKVVPAFLEKNGVVKDYSKLNEGQLAIVSLFGGMSAGCFSCVGNNPFDVVKTRMQGFQASQYKNTLDCAQQMLRKEGFLSFYTGVVPRLGRVIPGQGVIFMSYDTISRLVSSIVEKQ